MHWRSKLIQTESLAPKDFRSLAPPTFRGSTVVFESRAEVHDDWNQADRGYSYGLYGTPTTLELAARIAELEGARHTFITPGGQSAISLIYLALCDAGTHVLLPTTAYAPNAELAESLLKRLNITVERYDPLIAGGIGALIRPETALIWCESPGSITMEVQDVPAIVAAAHKRGLPVALDNTYAAGILFDAFSCGVDVSIQALTKYVGGHSDLLLGSVSVMTDEARDRIGETFRSIGMAVSPDDCSLALRGLRTLGVRLESLERSTLEIAKWLAGRPEIKLVLHPAFASCKGHDTWKRDFKGSASVFSIVFADHFTAQEGNSFVDSLKIFKIGWSWGGVTSLVMTYPELDRLDEAYRGRIVRLNIGLEHTADLIDDLAASLTSAR